MDMGTNVIDHSGQYKERNRLLRAGLYFRHPQRSGNALRRRCFHDERLRLRHVVKEFLWNLDEILISIRRFKLAILPLDCHIRLGEVEKIPPNLDFRYILAHLYPKWRRINEARHLWLTRDIRSGIVGSNISFVECYLGDIASLGYEVLKRSLR